MRRPALLLALAAALTGAATTAAAPHPTAKRTDAYPLHHTTTIKTSSRGPRVAELQWLIRNPRPKQNPWTKIKGTLNPHSYTKGIYDHPTAAAAVQWKYRVGYPARGQCGSKSDEWRQTKVTAWFMHLLNTGKGRPACWVAVASKRVQTAEGGFTTLGLKIKAVELSQLGVAESPPGSNYGPQIARYQSVTGAYREAWCASFEQWSFLHGGYGTFANRSAYVPYIIGWANARGYLNAKAKPGALVAYYGNESHIGLVARVTAAGFVDISGNYDNRVAEVFHRWGQSLQYFIWLPHVVR